MSDRLRGVRAVVTSCDTYMGPAIVELFRAEGADVLADAIPLLGPDEPSELIQRAGHVDVLIANLDLPAYMVKVRDIEDDQWLAGFDAMVHPLMRLVRAVAPQMVERGDGSIVAVTSSSPLRRLSNRGSPYVAARGAQNAFVRSAGHELANYGVRFNAIGQNYVRNDTYFPESTVDTDRFRDHLRRDVPARRLGEPNETAELALFLASDKSSFIYGQIISNDGGWS